MKRIILTPAILAMLVAACATDADEFVAGADMSHVAYFESVGITYRENGTPTDAFTILKNHGLNCVRLRLFTSSQSQASSNPYNYINNTNYTIPLAVRAKNAGLKFMLDFHYSDTWADPGKQSMPLAWTNMTTAQLRTQIQEYSSNCIAAFKAAGAMPEYVQVGNEITQGMLWNNGFVSGNNNASWANLGNLLKSAIAGIKGAAGDTPPKIILHIDRGGDWNTTLWWFDNITTQGVPYDMIGQSYYPFWHGSLNSLANCLTNTAQRYGKPVIVMETDFPWNNSTNVAGLPANTNGQVRYVVELAKIVKGIPNGLGAGIVWWGTEYQPVSGANQAGFGNRSFFNGSGNVLPAAGALGQTAAPVALGASLTNSNLKITWPLSGAGMSLTSSSNIALSGNWPSVTNAVQNTGTVFTVTVPTTQDESRFYRLEPD